MLQKQLKVQIRLQFLFKLAMMDLQLLHFADGSSATLSASQTVKVKVEATSGSETRSRSRREAAPATGISTRSFDSELQDALLNRRRSIAQVLKDKNKVTEGTVWLYRNGTISNDSQEDAKTPWWCKCLPSVCDW